MTAETSNARGEVVAVGDGSEFDTAMRAYELAAIKHGKTGDNAPAVDAAGARVFAMFNEAATPPPPADAEVWDDDIDDEHSCVAGGPAWQEGFNAGRATGRNEALDELRKAAPEARGVVDGVALIAAERQRQVEAEGWTPEHDDEHDDGALAQAAACYAFGPSELILNPRTDAPVAWPWEPDWWKPTDRIRDLTKAGALIAAEIDRLQRAALTEARNVR